MEKEKQMITIACVLGNEILDFDTVKDSDIEMVRINMLSDTPFYGVSTRNVEFRYWRFNNGKITVLPNRI